MNATQKLSTQNIVEELSSPRRLVTALGIAVGVALAAAVLPSWAQAAPAETKQPNIVYIVADDLGWKDVGFNDCTDIKTPNIDKLAETGARFTQFYAQPMCTPTRAALMTGRYHLLPSDRDSVCPMTRHFGS